MIVSLQLRSLPQTTLVKIANAILESGQSMTAGPDQREALFMLNRVIEEANTRHFLAASGELREIVAARDAWRRLMQDDRRNVDLCLSHDEFVVLGVILDFHADDEPGSYYSEAPFKSLREKVAAWQKPEATDAGA